MIVDHDRRLSAFGETWVRETDRGAGPPGARVGWYLWAAIGLALVVALVAQAST